MLNGSAKNIKKVLERPERTNLDPKNGSVKMCKNGGYGMCGSFNFSEQFHLRVKTRQLKTFLKPFFPRMYVRNISDSDGNTAFILFPCLL